MPASLPLQSLRSNPPADLPALRDAESRLHAGSAVERIQWAREMFGDRLVVTSSFGTQAAVMLHLATRVWPEIPVLVVDTGYLFPETYRFIDHLTERLRLRLEVARPALSPAWTEARYGRLWEAGREGLSRYNHLHKVDPMEEGLERLGARAWMSGLRRSQSRERANLPVLGLQNGRVKLHPIIDWSDEDVERYLAENALPYHPLARQGYVSIGDVHSTSPLLPGMTPEETRFFGLKRECGLHDRFENLSGDGI